MFELKPLSSTESAAAALAKAERYRLLNEPLEAESICLDVLAVEPDNQEALRTMLLAITDQFDEEGLAGSVARAQDVLLRLTDEYEREYYAGIIYERRAKAQLRRGGRRVGFVAYDWLRDAMRRYEAAEALRPPGNDDAILRWNACVRVLRQHRNLAPAEAREEPQFLE